MPTRTNRYFQKRAAGKTDAMTGKEEVAANNDNKIDQDFPGFPHGHAKPELIKPVTQQQKKTAAVNTKDGEKINYDEQQSDGSGGAFSATEEVEE